MAAAVNDNVDYRLLDRLSNLVICSGCLRRGQVTPVPQLISDRHSLTNECIDCRHAASDRQGARQALGQIIRFK